MYLFYDNQGNLISVNNQDIIVKGSSNANFIFVNVKGIDYAQYNAIATFKLPSASADGVQLVVSNTVKTIDYDGKQYQGYVIFLDDAITYYQGDVDFTLSLIKRGTSTTLNLEQFTFHVDESTMSGEPWDSYINQAQYENIMNYITGGQISFDYLGSITAPNANLSPQTFYDEFSETLLKDKSQGYYLVYGEMTKNYIPTNILVSSYITYGVKGTGHFVYAVYRNALTKQFEAIGYKEIFDLDDTNYFDYSKNTGTTATDNSMWIDDGDAKIGAESGEVSITLPISEIGLNVGEHINYSLDVSAGRANVLGSASIYLLDENLQELKATTFGFAFLGTKTIDLYGIEIIEKAKFIKLVVNKTTPAATTLSNFTINKYKEVMLPTTLTPDSVVQISQYSTDYQNLIDTINSDITNLERNVSALQQDVSDIQSDVNTINTTLGTLPYTCELTMNSQTYVVTLKLKDAKGATLSTQSVDLPLESTVISGSYDESSKAIVLTLKSGETISIPIGDLVDGLVSQTDFDNLENEVNSIDNRLSNLEEDVYSTRVGITSQYVSQPSDVKEGSNIYINAKLRDSVNLLDVANSTVSNFSDRTNVAKNNDGSIVLTFVEESSGNMSDYARIELTPSSLGLQVGDTITLSAVCNISDTTKRFYLGIYFYNQDYELLSSMASSATNSGNKATTTNTMPEGTTRIYLSLMKYYYDSATSGTTFTFSNIQLQKGNLATDYEPYGAYSKGKVMQYASKNILNLTGTKQTANTTSLIGKANVPYTIPNATTAQLLPQNDGSFGTTSANAKRINVKKNHKYFVLLDGNFQGSIPDAFGIYDSDFVFMNSAQVQLVTSHTYCGIVTPKQDANNAFVVNMYWYGTNKYFTQGDEVLDMLVIDLTANGYHNLTVEEAYDKYSSSVVTLQSGGSVANNVYQSPLIKVYSKELYLTKSIYYYFVLYEFKENPPFLNEDVSLDDLTLIKATTYSSSSQIELDPQTNSVMYFVYAVNYRPLSQEELAALQMTDQLEYGTSATEHSDYIAPIEIGTFDKSVDGNEKTFSFTVLGTENQNIGFMPQTNFISIDFAESVSDLTSSTFAYQSTNLATTVAELTQRVETLESQVASILEMLNNN